MQIKKSVLDLLKTLTWKAKLKNSLKIVKESYLHDLRVEKNLLNKP